MTMCRVVHVCMTVRLTYFKQSGKYYSKGSFRINSDTSMLDIHEQVKGMIVAGRLPGLVEGVSEFIVLVEVSRRLHNFPTLFNVGEGLSRTYDRR